MIDDKKIEVIMAAFLHDIGKFYQRTGRKISNTRYEDFAVGTKGMYRHASFTAQFLDKHLKDCGKIISPSSDHHNNKTGLISLSDCAASGQDRRENDCVEKENEEIDIGYNFIRRRQNSIFNEITLEGQNKESFIKISTDDNFEFDIKTKDNTVAKNEYNEHFKAFLSEIDNLDYSNLYELHQKIYPRIKKYTTTIPGSTYNMNVSTVSLFDHSKLTAAIASCLYEKCDDDLLFLDFDMSGIQQFIYSITEGKEVKKDIAKSLRARSFYLVLLNDFIAYYILNEFELPQENLLYSSGGRGTLLLPNIGDNIIKKGIKNLTLEKLDKAIRKIENEIFKLHYGTISFTFNIFTCKVSDIRNYSYKSIKDIIEDENILVGKSQRFLNVLRDKNFKYVSDGINKLCPLCEINDAYKGKLCSFCQTILEMDKYLCDESFIIEFNFNKLNSNQFKISFAELGNAILYKINEIFNFNKDSYYLTINDFLIGETKYYAGLLTNDEGLEGIAKKSIGDEKTAVIKMDVDNLGYIFNKGIDQKVYSISKTLTLSRSIDYFFTKKLSEICQKEKDVFINYSGGDDLVIFAPASNCLNLTNKIIKEFQKYTTNNKAIHISAGIEIFNVVKPVRFAILRAEEELTNAKRNEGKNATSIFGICINNQELDSLITEIERYQKLINNETISKGCIYNLYSAILKAKSIKDYRRYMPSISYSLTRNVKDLDTLEMLKNEFVAVDIELKDLKFYEVVFAITLMTLRNPKEGK